MSRDMKRRDFIRTSIFGFAGLLLAPAVSLAREWESEIEPIEEINTQPISEADDVENTIIRMFGQRMAKELECFPTGRLTAEQCDRFINYVVDETFLKNKIEIGAVNINV